MNTTSFFLGTVSTFNSNKAKEDANGLMPMIIEPLAGSCPTKRVIAGTIAKNMDLEAGCTYLFKFTRLEDDTTYGSQYNFMKLSPTLDDPMKILEICGSLGEVKLIGE